MESAQLLIALHMSGAPSRRKFTVSGHEPVIAVTYRTSRASSLTEAAGVGFLILTDLWAMPEVMAPSEPVDGVCRLLYEQLVILFHDHECDGCGGADGIIQYSALPLCHSVDAIFSHMKYCRAGMSCEIPGCPSARAIMSHWKICRNKECPVVINLSTDRKQKIQLLLQAEVNSFSSGAASCQYLNNQLILLFNDHECETCAETHHQRDGGLPLCHSVDAVLSHMKYCRAGMCCKLPGCPAARAIVSHWKTCKETECPVVCNLRRDRKQNIQKRQEPIQQESMLPIAVQVKSQIAKNFRKVLFEMFHAWTCMCRQKSQGISSDCDLPQCKSMKTLLRHTKTCAEGPHCEYPKCTIIRFIFVHYMTCIQHDCIVCWPVRSVIKQICGTSEHSTMCPSNKIWQGRPLTATMAPEEKTKVWLSPYIYQWFLTKDRPLIGPPLFQRGKPQQRRWKQKSKISCNWMRKHPYRWRHSRSSRVQLRPTGKNSLAVPFPL